jgi:D-alanine-D-alanine ligase
MTFNKSRATSIEGFWVKVADSLLLRKGQSISTDDLVARLGLPCFIKSNVGGSSFGVSKVTSPDEVQPAIDRAFAEGPEVVAEAFLKGTELTCGCYKTRLETRVLPVTEVVPMNDFFDYDDNITVRSRKLPRPYQQSVDRARSADYILDLRHSWL